ncbi:MAG: 23S rRNA (uracil(1939)-C(5))-methyltransferase RlmD [Bacteroidota bacterium]
MGRKKSKARVIEQVEITGTADKGRSVGRDRDGQVIFVEHVAPGDILDVIVVRKRKGIMEGVPKSFYKYSEHRIAPFCEHFGICGGCKWQHITYKAQLMHKELVVKNALRRIAKIQPKEFCPILAAEKTAYYRNKIEFTFSNKRWLTRFEIAGGKSNYKNVLGFHRPAAFDKIVDIQHCFLQSEPSNHIRNTIREIALEQELSFFDIKEKKGFLRNMLLRITTLGQVMLIISFHYEDVEMRTNLLDELLRRVPGIDSVYYCINGKGNDFMLDLPLELYKGTEWIEEMLGDVRFRIGPKSFFQTNTRQAVRLFDVVKDFAQLSGRENVYDLYTGIGSIGLYLAKDCKQIVGIEEIGPAIEDAKINAALNNFENTVFYAGDVKDILTHEFADKHGKPDVLITDPPRAGMHPKVVQMLLQLEAPKIVYVSCNPATQARDLLLLKEKYSLEKIRPVDMFPHTHHIETVALLHLKE